MSERRLVSVVFVDLVGFTTLSEQRDAEAVRELLSRYFDTCKQVISRYGGVVEKFIGDAVMAVWGTPVAQEDDAERAVRAALEIVSSVSAMGVDLNAPQLLARAGVLTGEAAVTLGAQHEGMVAGDLVNTASRIQSSADPGTVLVGDSTRHATEAAIAYADAGVHVLKGKADPVPLHRAQRVTAGRAGVLRGAGSEMPFVGRGRELRLVKELYHASAEERRAHLVTVSGVAGVGKSRLVWEFEKYADGLADDVLWHRGRCLAYGEGVVYWALAEMVRMRAGIHEDDEPATARTKLELTLEEFVTDAQERQWVEPRIEHLLGLESAPDGDHENLYAAWRIFFERVAEQGPTVLVFEDLQWAEEGLLEFVSHLLKWSRSLPLFVLLLTRPESGAVQPSLTGQRNSSSLYLEPLLEAEMSELLTAMVPGLPSDLAGRILDRAEGIPLYAVETVRMLLDRGLLEQAGSSYRATSTIEALEVPETLHALIAARLDGLDPAERSLLQDAAVLGKAFTRQDLAALHGAPAAQIDRHLDSLVAKEMLGIQADPRSPERGQHCFLQDLARRVAYETIARKDRKAKHLALAQRLLSASGVEEGEATEVAASHYLAAYEHATGDPDQNEIGALAREALVRAAERSASLAAGAEAQRAFERAITLTSEPLEQAHLHERAGTMAATGARADEASEHFQESMSLFSGAGDTRAAARVSARLAEIQWERGRLAQGLEQMERALAVLSELQPDADVAALAAQVGRFRLFSGDPGLAAERLETALSLAETLALPEVIAQALNSKALVLLFGDRREEGTALLQRALEVALAHDKQSAALRAYYNLADGVFTWGDAYADGAATVRRGLERARKIGSRYWEWAFLGYSYPFYALGEWDQVLAMHAELPREDWTGGRIAHVTLLTSAVPVCAHRGLVEDAARMVEVVSQVADSADVQERCQYGFAQAQLLHAAGERERALSIAEEVLIAGRQINVAFDAVKESLALAVGTANELGTPERLVALVRPLEALAPGRRSRFVDAQLARVRAVVAAAGGDEEAASPAFVQAEALLSEIGTPFHLAVVRTEHAEWLESAGRSDDAAPLRRQATLTFEHLEAVAWLARAGAANGRESDLSLRT